MTGHPVVLLTGGSRGLGHAAAHRFAALGAQLLLTARDGDRAEAAAARIRAAVPGARVRGLALDLASGTSVRACAAEVAARTPRLDVLLANAAAPPPPRRTLTAEGRELVLATDHLGHVLLTALLVPLLRATAADRGGARVVAVGSRLHHPARPGPRARLDPEDLDGVRYRYRLLRAYRTAKLANLLLAVELDRRERAHGVRALALCPGFVPASVGGDTDGWRGVLHRRIYPALPFARSPDQAADAYVHAATAPLHAVAGRFLGDRRPIRPSRDARDPDLAARLWTVSAELTGAPPG